MNSQTSCFRREGNGYYQNEEIEMMRNSDCRFQLYRGAIIWLLLLMAYTFVGCNHSGLVKVTDLSDNVRSFWGDSTVVLQISKPQNGYLISIIHNKDLIIALFERGDTISGYCALEWLPDRLKNYEDAEPGVYAVDLDIPVIKIDTLDDKHIPNSDIFFMNVNFDGEEEFVQAISSNGWVNYTCYDLVNGIRESLSPGVVPAMKQPPYDSFSTGIEPMQNGYVVFNHEKKEIFVRHGSGCCAFTDTWTKYFEGDSLGNSPCLKVVEQEYHSFSNGTETIETYVLLNDTLKLVGITKQKN